MNRNRTSLINTSPLRLKRVRTFPLDGPAALSFMYAGSAIRDWCGQSLGTVRAQSVL